MLQHPLILAMLGVPLAQARLIARDHQGGIAHYVRGRLEHRLAEVPMRDNYFWRVYVHGAYHPVCCPNYLRPEHFAWLRRHCHRVGTYPTSLANVLRLQPGPYSHFALLDHQDWLAAHDPAALAEEWRLLLASSHPGTRILMRSAAPTLDFLPSWVGEAVRFQPARTDPLHAQDRVGTYAGLFLAEVR